MTHRPPPILASNGVTGLVTSRMLLTCCVFVLLASTEWIVGGEAECRALVAPKLKYYRNEQMRSLCGTTVKEQCLKRPQQKLYHQIDPFKVDCNLMPVIDDGDDCKQPGTPLHLNASVSHASRDFISIIVDWKMPTYPDYCPLTGFHVTIWKKGSDNLRGEPCICFNVSEITTNVVLSSDGTQNGCISECLELDKMGMRTELDIVVTSLPLPADKISKQSVLTSLSLPSCQELDPRPDYCHLLPPAPPTLSSTILKNGSVHIRWNEPKHDSTINITKYILMYRRRDGPPIFHIEEVGPETREYMTGHQDLEFDVSYVFWVQADSTSVKSASRDGRSGYSKAEYVTLASIDGGWSEWSKFPPCDVCTSDTVTTRSRTCNNPEPHFGGKPCEGSSRQNMPCNLTLPCIATDAGRTSPGTSTIFLTFTGSEFTEDTKETEPAPVAFYQKTTFFITLCVGVGCLMIFFIFLIVTYRYYKPARNLASESHKLPLPDSETPTKYHAQDGDNFSLQNETLRPDYPLRHPSTGEFTVFDSPLPRRPHNQLPTVYISYSRKQEGQMDRIFDFCNWLNSWQFDVKFDRWEENTVAEDIAGWIQRSIEKSHFIISICSKTYNQGWLKMGAETSSKDIRSVCEDLEGSQMKRLHLETLLINTQLMANGGRNTMCIPVILLDTHCKSSIAQCVPNALSNSTVYPLVDTNCDEAYELLCRLHGVEQWQRPEIPGVLSRRIPSGSSNDSGTFSVGSGTSTTTTFVESNYTDVVMDSSSCSDDTASR